MDQPQLRRSFLLEEGPEESPRIDPDVSAPIEDIRSAYKTALLRSHAEDMVALAMERGIKLSMEEALRRTPPATDQDETPFLLPLFSPSETTGMGRGHW